MSEDHTLKFFREHYIEHRHVEAEKQEGTREAFMAGAHTTMLMITKFLSEEKPEISMRKLTQELHEYMVVKNAEEQFKHATVH